MLYPCKNAFLFLLKYLSAILPYFGEGYNVEFSGSSRLPVKEQEMSLNWRLWESRQSDTINAVYAERDEGSG